MKSVRIRSYSGPYFPACGLNTEIYEVSLGIQPECGKMWTRITPNTDTFQAVCSFCLSFNGPLVLVQKECFGNFKMCVLKILFTKTKFHVHSASGSNVIEKTFKRYTSLPPKREES